MLYVSGGKGAEKWVDGGSAWPTQQEVDKRSKTNMGAKKNALGRWWDELSGTALIAAKDKAETESDDYTRRLREYIPDLEQLQYNNPEEYAKFIYEAQQLGPSAFAGIQERAQLQNAQDETLARLAQLSEGKLGTQDVANLRQIRDTVGQQERSQREAMAQEAQGRGIGGSGLDLMRQMQVQQGAAQKAAAGGWDVAEQAANRGLQALSQRGQLATTVRGQELGKAQAAAQAQDEIARFNASAMNQQRQYNANQEWQKSQANRNAYNQRYNMGTNVEQVANANRNYQRVYADAERTRQKEAWETAGKAAETTAKIAGVQMPGNLNFTGSAQPPR